MNKLLIEQLQPLADELEKARSVVQRAGEIIHAHTKATEFAFELTFRRGEFSSNSEPAVYWLKLSDDDQDFHADINSVINSANKFSPEAETQRKIAKLRAELAELEGK